MYGFEFYKDTKTYSAFVNAVFAAGHRLLFVLPFVVGVVLYTSTGFSKLVKTKFEGIFSC